MRLSDEVDRLGDDLASPGDDAGEGAAPSLDVGVGQIDGSLDQIYEETPCARRSMGLATVRSCSCNLPPTAPRRSCCLPESEAHMIRRSGHPLKERCEPFWPVSRPADRFYRLCGAKDLRADLRDLLR